MNASSPVEQHGLFSLTGDAVEIMNQVDAAVLDWASRCGATIERHPELMTTQQLDRVDYFDSFPHLAHRVTPWLSDSPGDASLVLTSAACYGVYFARTSSAVDDLEVVTIRQTCRRREDSYQPLRRQREFQMREVVALGADTAVESFLREGKTFVGELTERFGIEGDFTLATDPFFRKDDPRLLHQRLFPTKQEFVDSSGLAISSINSHRNFFGERCAIQLASSGVPTTTGCVAFGLERWTDAVLRAGET